ncbi:YitT family protein [Pseudomonas sp. DTU_2021_1001937_2_SI_NGA_ILE_001]|uniref:YitT family protein n=1 Tax=Pseudomonas sp. DTU_2021_1001937_2_SI_NGA_ILE_001 TaxID=3077589 RepID=UPI0025FA4A09|nr:YitT family protein [Pseudomonas sp. DTU_2021_1001937_2_SI_NGA_ILE_001]WNW11522.1 YitT family protein [Pseudomonas sp. DTU_2021_1001937_2_SI_NGA_ILE_001]
MHPLDQQTPQALVGHPVHSLHSRSGNPAGPHAESRGAGRTDTPLDSPTTYPRHTAVDDAYGLFTGITLAATGIAILGQSGLITGGIAGMALLGSFLSPYSAALLVPLINVPFLLFALFTMGRSFALKSVLVSFALGAGVKLVSPALNASGINPEIGWVIGGTLLGMGILCLARHNASMGGTGAMVLWIQRRFAINAGISQLVCDCILFGVAAFFMPADKLIWSLIGTVAMNLVLIRWHKPGRYRG